MLGYHQEQIPMATQPDAEQTSTEARLWVGIGCKKGRGIYTWLPLLLHGDLGHERKSVKTARKARRAKHNLSIHARLIHPSPYPY